MTRKEKLDELARQHNRTKAQDAAEPSEAPNEKPDLDLDDPVTQERILNPDGNSVALSYGSVTLYPPSAMVRRMAYAFCQEVIADSVESKPSTKEVFTMRVLSNLMASAAPQLRLFRLIATMCGKPGKIDDKAAIELSTEIAEKASPDDVAVLFEQLSLGAGFRLGPAPAKK